MSLYPSFAHVMKERMRLRGSYAKGWPVGAIVHFTAGRDGAENTIQGGIKDGYTYWCIQRDGKLFCAHPANQWGYHAGESSWRRAAKKLIGSVSDDLIGIELNAAGRCTKLSSGKFKTWYGEILAPSEVRYTPGVDNQQEGWYHKYTEAQELTLTETLLWLKEQRPDVFDFDFVLGHDCVAGPWGLGYWRKNDPGAALSMTIPKYQEFLKAKYALRSAK